jgi:hypothetical protein
MDLRVFPDIWKPLDTSIVAETSVAFRTELAAI